MEVERVVTSFGISYRCKETGQNVKVIWFSGDVDVNQKFTKSFPGPYNIWGDGTRFFYSYHPDETFKCVIIKKADEE